MEKKKDGTNRGRDRDEEKLTGVRREGGAGSEQGKSLRRDGFF
jgi:hypothetical protein